MWALPGRYHRGDDPSTGALETRPRLALACAVLVAVLAPYEFANRWGVRNLATNGQAVAAFGDDGFVRLWVVRAFEKYEEGKYEEEGEGEAMIQE